MDHVTQILWILNHWLASFQKNLALVLNLSNLIIVWLRFWHWLTGYFLIFLDFLIPQFDIKPPWKLLTSVIFLWNFSTLKNSTHTFKDIVHFIPTHGSYTSLFHVVFKSSLEQKRCFVAIKFWDPVTFLGQWVFEGIALSCLFQNNAKN